MNLFLIFFVEKKLDGDKRGAKGLWVCICMEGRESIGQCVCGRVWGAEEVVARERELRM